jgi:hypothetical protein
MNDKGGAAGRAVRGRLAAPARRGSRAEIEISIHFGGICLAWFGRRVG